MVRKVAIYLFWGLLVVLAIVWLLGGGIEKIKAAVASYQSPLGFFGSELYGGGAVQLPWAVPVPEGADISNVTGNGSGNASQGSQAQTFGNQSQYSNQIAITAEGATASDPQQEYIVVQNTGQASIDISGWSLQSALTGARAYLPLAASFFRLGEVNSETRVDLAPGGIAVVSTGRSPVGTSFRENVCSGYLEKLQQYTPPIETQCPSPSDAASQASQYGDACSQYAASIPFCSFPQNPPSNISAQCQAFVQTTFSYNGCVAIHQNDTGFASNTWRLFLEASRELWKNDHDTIRLLDAQGQTVAVTSY